MTGQNSKIHGFKNDIFLAGPPDRRVGEPYKKMITEAFPGLTIYDWETYKGDNYQDINHAELKDSFYFVGMVPDFPMPAIGEEVGYFFHHHEHRVKYCRQGLRQNSRRVIFGDKQDDEGVDTSAITSPPVNPIILIWPDAVRPDFAKRTYSQLAQIVPAAEEAINQIKENQKYLAIWHNEVYPGIKSGISVAEIQKWVAERMNLNDKDPFLRQPGLG